MKNVASCFVLLISGLLNAQFTGKPQYDILTMQNGDTLGITRVELYPNIAPKHVRNWDSLVAANFYDSLAFHRCIPGFMIQGGDPNTKNGPINTWGFGQPGQPKVKAEFSVLKHLRGTLSMARSNDINSATSQFFICVATASTLDGKYSAFGKVISGMNTVDTIVKMPKYASPYTDTPIDKVTMFIDYVGSNDAKPAAPQLTSPPTGTVDLDTAQVFLKWNPVTDGLLYDIYVSGDSLFSDTLRRGTQLTNSFNFFNLDGNKQYFWKVIVNNGGHSTPSPVWNFSTKAEWWEPSTTGMKEVKPEEVVVYPNPSHGTFTIKGLRAGLVVKIYDAAGKLIEEKICNNSECAFDLGEDSRGVYLYKISSAEGEVFSGQIICR